MKTMIKYGIAMALATLAITGCASRKPKVVLNPYPAQATVQVIPPQGRPEPKVEAAVDRALPVYSNPIIEEVDMAPYVDDENGTLMFPGKMLVIRTPGHWNLEAAKRNNQYYIPADNMPPQLAPPSRSYYDYIQSKKNGAGPAAGLDVSSVHVTGFTLRAEEEQARATLKPGETLSFDPFLGWIAIPTALLQSGGTLNQPQTVQPKPLPPPQKALEGTPAPGSDNIPAAQPAPGDAPPSSREQEVKQIIEDAFKNAGAPGTPNNKP